MIDRNDLELNTGFKNGLRVEVAIIGGGVAGLYTGYRLLDGEHHHPDQRIDPSQVHIFELSHRIGGRLWSVQLPGMSVWGELGGMRYLPTQEIVTALAETVFADRMKAVDFSMGDPAHLFFYLRKQRFRANAWNHAQVRGERFKTGFILNEGDVGYSPDQLFNKIIYDVMHADPAVRNNYGDKIRHPKPDAYEFRLTRREWNEIKPVLIYNFPGPYAGMRVADMGFWNLIQDRVSAEGYQFLSEAGGYYSLTINWNAAEAFPYLVGDFSKTGPVGYRTIEGGYDQIAYALAQAFCRTPGAAIWAGNSLVDFEAAPASDGSRYRLTILNHKSHKPWIVHANRIVLAMPGRSLELVKQSNFFVDRERNEDLHHAIVSVTIEPSFKILMGFAEPWWKGDFGALAGESLTDLPMRQCYYFGTDPENSHSLFLAGYNDMRTVRFWSALEDPSDRFEAKPTRHARREALDEWQSVQAPRVMVEEAMKQVRELHGHLPDPIADPYVTYYKDWSKDPFGGGYHGWKARIAVQDVMRYMRRPNPSEPIYLCGEAYSEQQGWVEGALCTAEHMLQDYFDLKWPRWLARDYYLGW